MNTDKITLSDYQLKKIQQAYKRQEPVRFRLSYEQLVNGRFEVALTPQQLKRLKKCRENGKGLDLTITYEQLKLNHTGGFLPLLFAGLGALGALIGGGAAVANSVVNAQKKGEELEEFKRHNRAMEHLGKGVRNLSVKKSRGKK